ncbi:HAD family hydrolase [Dysgonomonas sp. 520]|uniref:HAD family hydrolase n=1 Tax=Dysgonomonas sp. 520 TaxID=2302931 RepID=UPI0013D6623F|nr:HAD hydrolase-like protein [Dysgonomonas sp. 520]NDW10019.1 HAD family hydrolase [Dysgonomonas sp. 520]
MELKETDSLIFDMDGTLWDAVDTYAYCWNIAFKKVGLNKEFTGQDLVQYMGIEAKKIFTIVFPDLTDDEIDSLFKVIAETVDEHLPVMGGKVYPDVIEGLHKLSKKYKLFMLSNCQKGSIGDFMKYTNTQDLFLDYFEHGANHQPKHVNIHTLMEKYDLKNPVYVGDTDSDRKQCDIAKIPYIFVSYGFGTTDKYAKKFDSFAHLTNYFMDH